MKKLKSPKNIKSPENCAYYETGFVGFSGKHCKRSNKSGMAFCVGVCGAYRKGRTKPKLPKEVKLAELKLPIEIKLEPKLVEKPKSVEKDIGVFLPYRIGDKVFVIGRKYNREIAWYKTEVISGSVQSAEYVLGDGSHGYPLNQLIPHVLRVDFDDVDDYQYYHYDEISGSVFKGSDAENRASERLVGVLKGVADEEKSFKVGAVDI